ncbi:ly6/PLAUR domain-containing protein 2-like [Bufo bufo]|uniref:ly6/PLAUR domain-containing protein 2-like n=1 Tax=Bufo bufo TaxID=8384 RepID=UPI001ABE1BF5|nr:ly6/PLAUR domain-containing protein 2-like [Bufo bufo]
MTTTRMFLVALALCFQTGGSILCYFCPDQTLSSECTDQKNCTATDSVCKTTVLSPDVGFPFQGNEIVIRGCSTRTTCIPSDQDELGNSRFVLCCNIDLCNSRGLNATSNSRRAAAEISVAMGGFLLGILVPLIVIWP